MECDCKPCAVVAVVKSSSMVVICSSEPRMMSSANLRFAQFAVAFGKSDSVVVSDRGFRLCCDEHPRALGECGVKPCTTSPS